MKDIQNVGRSQRMNSVNEKKKSKKSTEVRSVDLEWILDWDRPLREEPENHRRYNSGEAQARREEQEHFDEHAYSSYMP